MSIPATSIKIREWGNGFKMAEFPVVAEKRVTTVEPRGNSCRRRRSPTPGPDTVAGETWKLGIQRRDQDARERIQEREHFACLMDSM